MTRGTPLFVISRDFENLETAFLFAYFVILCVLCG